METRNHGNRQHGYKETFTVQKDLMGLVIGTKGSNINKARGLDGIHAVYNRLCRDSKDYLFTIVGENENVVRKARSLLQFRKEAFYVPSKYAGIVIGKHGQQMDDIMAKSMLHCIEKEDEEDGIVLNLIGATKQIEYAKVLLNRIIQEPIRVSSRNKYVQTSDLWNVNFNELSSLADSDSGDDSVIFLHHPRNGPINTKQSIAEKPNTKPSTMEKSTTKPSTIEKPSTKPSAMKKTKFYGGKPRAKHQYNQIKEFMPKRERNLHVYISESSSSNLNHTEPESSLNVVTSDVMESFLKPEMSKDAIKKVSVPKGKFSTKDRNVHNYIKRAMEGCVKADGHDHCSRLKGKIQNLRSIDVKENCYRSASDCCRQSSEQNENCYRSEMDDSRSEMKGDSYRSELDDSRSEVKGDSYRSELDYSRSEMKGDSYRFGMKGNSYGSELNDSSSEMKGDSYRSKLDDSSSEMKGDSYRSILDDSSSEMKGDSYRSGIKGNSYGSVLEGDSFRSDAEDLCILKGAIRGLDDEDKAEDLQKEQKVNCMKCRRRLKDDDTSKELLGYDLNGSIETEEGEPTEIHVLKGKFLDFPCTTLFSKHTRSLNKNDDHKLVDEKDSETRSELLMDKVKVIKYLIQKHEGICQTMTLQEVFGGDCLKNWLKDMAQYFHLYKVGSQIEYVAPYLRDVQICRHYGNSCEQTQCVDETCQHLHICQKFVRGNCNRRNCHHPHDFKSAHNQNLKKVFNLEHFSDMEIIILLNWKFPRICYEYNHCENGCPLKEFNDADNVDNAYSNGKPNCPFLHYCKQYFYGHCFHSDQCKLNHFFATPHNSWVLSSCHSSNLTEDVLKKVIFVPYQKKTASRKLKPTDKNTGSGFNNKAGESQDPSPNIRCAKPGFIKVHSGNSSLRALLDKYPRQKPRKKPTNVCDGEDVSKTKSKKKKKHKNKSNSRFRSDIATLYKF